jgi:hypothetical protein
MAKGSLPMPFRFVGYLKTLKPETKTPTFPLACSFAEVLGEGGLLGIVNEI